MSWRHHDVIKMPDFKTHIVQCPILSKFGGQRGDVPGMPNLTPKNDWPLFRIIMNFWILLSSPITMHRNISVHIRTIISDHTLVSVNLLFTQQTGLMNVSISFRLRAVTWPFLPVETGSQREYIYNSKTVKDIRMLPTLSVSLDISSFAQMIDDVMQCSSAP